MLDLYVTFCRSFRIAYSLILLLSFAINPLYSTQFWEDNPKPIKHFEHEWITRYFDSIDENTEIGEVIDFLIAIRESWLARGYECPSLLELAIRLKEYLIQNGVEINEQEIQELYEEIYRREQFVTPIAFKSLPNLGSKSMVKTCKHKHKHKSDKKEIKMKSKGVFGFLKALAGGLMCLVPITPVQVAGGALIVDGIKDMIDDARETGDENEHQQKLDELRRQEAQTLKPA